MINLWSERLSGRAAGGREIVAVYAGHVYLGALACETPVADALGVLLRLPERLAQMHRPCHEEAQPLARRSCGHGHLADEPQCVECSSDGDAPLVWPCPTVRLTTPAAVQPVTPAWGLLMGGVGGGKTDGQALAEAEAGEYAQDLAIQEGR